MRALGHWLSLLGKIISHVNWNEIYLPKYPGTVPIGNSDTIGNLEKVSVSNMLLTVSLFYLIVCIIIRKIN